MRVAVVPEVSESDRRWFRKVDGKIWTRTVADDAFKTRHAFEKREMMAEEWQKARKLIRSHQLPCELHSDCYGHLFMVVYAHPAAIGLDPEVLMVVGNQNLPGWKRRYPARRDDNYEWEALSLLTHSRRNCELLSLYKLNPSLERGHYEY